MDGTRVPPAVDRGDFPSAPANPAEAPPARAAISFRERSGAVRAGAAAFCQLVYGDCVVEHLFDQWYSPIVSSDPRLV